MNKARENEEYFFRKFISVLDRNNLYTIDNTQIDKPDFLLIDNNGKKIGVEITEYHIDEGNCFVSELPQSKKRESIIKSTKQKLCSEYSIDFFKDITMKFNLIDTTCRTIDDISSELVKFLYKSQNMHGVISRDSYSSFLPEIDFLYISEESFFDFRFQALMNFSNAPINKSKIVRIINDKDLKSKGYKKFDENWLLIVVNFMNPSSDQYIPNNICNFSSKFFDKIYLYRVGFEPINIITINRNE